MMRKKTTLVFVLSAAALLIICGALLFFTHFAVVNGKLYSLSVSTVDLKDSGIDSISVLNRFSKLESADVSGNPVKSLPALKNCQALNLLRVSGSDFSAEECVEFYEYHPKTRLECGVVIGENRYSSLASSVELAEGLGDETIRSLAALKNLETLDLRGSVVNDKTYEYLKEKLPGCVIVRKVSFDGAEYLSTDESVKLSADFFEKDYAETELARLSYFESLKEIDAFACKDSEALIDLRERFPQYKVRWYIKVLDKKFDTSASEIDLSNHTYSLDECIKAFDQKLSRFSNLKKIIMLDCGLSDLKMEKLMARYPDVKFVWYVAFSRYKVRTDAVAFSTLIAVSSEADNLNEHTMAPLFKYCTDLVSLDIGHCHCRHIDEIANLKQLRALIIMNNNILDISPFAALTKLEFLEMNGNYVSSVEPLSGLKNLKMVNLYGSSGIKDLSPLYNHPSLEIVLFDKAVPKAEQQRFIESNPNCDSYFAVESEGRTTNVAWRAAPLREKYKNSFRKWKNVTGFDEETETFSYDFS